jgi:single-stranded DNA-binding protein
MELWMPLPVLPCLACGVVAAPQVSPGTGPHALMATCGSCGRFLKWLPKALVQPQKENARMMASVNRVVLVGEIGRYGVTVRYADSGTPCASFALVLQEQGQDGKAFQTLVDCQVWGKKAEAAGELEAGQLVLFEGKLAKRKKGEQWELCGSGVSWCRLPSCSRR